MRIHKLVQGSAEWNAHRAGTHNASDAPTMLGCSPYMSRNDLIKNLATGSEREINAATQRIFDDGHRYEGLARPIADEIVGETLYPVTGSDDFGLSKPLGASFDGLTAADDIAFEHKSLNDEIRAALPLEGMNENAELPKVYRVQMEQQLMVSDADRALFMASKWNGEELVEERHCWYYPDETLRAEILAGWKQLEADVAAYEHVEVIPAAKAAPIKDLPALDIQITGNVVASNFTLWRDIVVERIGQINTDLQTDQHFADAAKMVTFLDDGEKRIKLVKEQAQSQASSIDEVFRALDQISAEMKAKRLELNRLVETRKESIRAEILQEGREALKVHIDQINATLKRVSLPAINADFATAMKGKRTVDTLRSAMQDTLAAAKIEANQIADGIRYNLTTYDEIAAEFPQLFPDLATIVTKAKDDFTSTVKLRISEHKEAERVRLEKVEQEAAAAREAEQRRLADDEERRQQQAGQVAAKAIEEARKTEPVASPVAMTPPASIPAEQIEAGNVTSISAGRVTPANDDLINAITQRLQTMDRQQLNLVLMFCKEKIAA